MRSKCLCILCMLLVSDVVTYAAQRHDFTPPKPKTRYANDGRIHYYDFDVKVKSSDLKTTSPHLGIWITKDFKGDLPKGVQARFFHINVTERMSSLTRLNTHNNAEKGSAEDALSMAYIAYDTGSFDEALKLFTAFLSKYPDHPLAPYAMFMTGQTLCLLHKYKEANEVHGLLLKKFPDSPWAMEAFLRIACVTAGHLGDEKNAMVLFERIAKNVKSREIIADAIFYMAAINMINLNKEAAAAQFGIIARQMPDTMRHEPAKECLVTLGK